MSARTPGPLFAALIPLLWAGCADTSLSPTETDTARPVAVAGADQLLALEPQPEGGLEGAAWLDGTRSFAPGRPGATLEFSWQQLDGPAEVGLSEPSAGRTRVELTEAGLYVFSLVVRDGARASLPARTTVQARGPAASNAAPVAEVAVTPSRPVVGAEVVADGRGSFDPDAPEDSIVSFLWELTSPAGDVREEKEATELRFVPDAPGAWWVALRVVDTRGAEGRKSVRVDVASCEPSGDEVCDFDDDDCDGWIDEDFDVDDDGVTACGGDCDDDDPLRFPEAAEICDGRDNDCDDVADEGHDRDQDGVTRCAGDCDDEDERRSPELEEICDGVDNDCDQQLDEGFDADEDGYTDCGGDCAPDDGDIHPGATDICDGIDDDCDDQDGRDADEDGFTDCEEGIECDGDPDRNPGVPEVLGNGIDENCDGVDSLPVCEDEDEDGYCRFVLGCDKAAASCEEEWDCSDRDQAIFPGAEESCDRRDNDCDGAVDEGLDGDGDGILPCLGDCDDERIDICPICEEVCDGADNNCDGRVDENLPDCEP